MSAPERAATEVDNFRLALTQLRAAQKELLGSTQYTETRNAVFVMVSVVGSATLASFWRLLSKSVSIAVFITGTTLFASVTLVPLPMAVMALTLVLNAGVFGHAIAGWMVGRVAEEEPMIHVIVNGREEADHAICYMLTLKYADGADVQVEIDGHIFVNGRRVTTRSWWYVSILGVLAKPYHLLRIRDTPSTTRSNASVTGLLSGTASKGGLDDSPAAEVV